MAKVAHDIKTIHDGFHGLDPKELIRKTYVKRGEQRSYDEEAREIGELIGGEENFQACQEIEHVPNPMGLMDSFVIYVKDRNNTKFMKEGFCCRLISGEAAAALLDDGNVLVQTTKVMTELLRGLCKASDEKTTDNPEEVDTEKVEEYLSD